MEYTSRHAVILYKVTAETIRAWSEEFTEFLSVMANPGKGRHRVFTDEDMQVFAYIAERKKQGALFEQIHAELANGSRGVTPPLPPEEIQMLVADEQEKRLSLEVEHLQLSFGRLKQQYEDALARAQQADELKEKFIQAQIELEIVKRVDAERIQELAAELSRARQRIEELAEKVGQSYANGVLDTLERREELAKRNGTGE